MRWGLHDITSTNENLDSSTTNATSLDVKELIIVDI